MHESPQNGERRCPPPLPILPRERRNPDFERGGGFTQQDIDQLRGDILQWVNISYQQWVVDENNFRSFNNNTMRQQVNVNTVLTNQQEGEVSVTMIEAD